MKLEIDIDPVAKGRPRFTKYGPTYTPKKTEDFEEHLRYLVISKKPEMIDAACHIDLTFVREVPKSWSKKKKKEAIAGDSKPVTRPDLDNYEKAVLDALNGILYKDDSQIVSKTSQKIYGSSGKIIIEVHEV